MFTRYVHRCSHALQERSLTARSAQMRALLYTVHIELLDTVLTGMCVLLISTHPCPHSYMHMHALFVRSHIHVCTHAAQKHTLVSTFIHASCCAVQVLSHTCESMCTLTGMVHTFASASSTHSHSSDPRRDVTSVKDPGHLLHTLPALPQHTQDPPYSKRTALWIKRDSE